MKLQKWVLIPVISLPIVAYSAVIGGDTGTPSMSGQLQQAQYGTPPAGVAVQATGGAWGAGETAGANASNAAGMNNALSQAQGGGGAAKAAAGSGKGGIQGNISAVEKILGTSSSSKTEAPEGPQPGSEPGTVEPMTNEDVGEVIKEKIMDQFKAAGRDCACPYNVNEDGFECGVESAYYKPGGYRIVCFPKLDLRGQQYIFYRKTH